ncbi:MAG: hypothetical protein JSS02_14260 [Planctomycetes bacterium]|nr:hypothetical protein [Planctomycetota bacterium]
MLNKSETASGKKQRLFVTAGILLALAIGVAVRSANHDGTVVRVPVAQPTPEVKAADIVDRHLAWADGQGQADIAQTVQPIREFFAEARLGSRKFAEESLSLKSKWKVLTDFLSDGQDHKVFLEEQFAIHVFRSEALEAAVQSAVSSHVRHLDDVDSALLVRLEADLASVPNLQLSANIDRQAMQASLDAAVRQAIDATQAELLPGVGLELVSYLAGEVLGSAAFSLGTSTGILSVGAASGMVSLGVGLVVGIIVDAVVSWVYDAVYDPVGQLTTQINQTLDSLEQAILSGNADAPGLIQRLQDYGTRRGQSRNATIRSVVLPPSGNSTILSF